MPSYRLGRVLLAEYVTTLFRVDPEWTKLNLLPCFNWRSSASEAIAVWQGFLYSPRLYAPLFEFIKSDFLETAKHYQEMGALGRQYASLLTFAALEPSDIFTRAELKEATEALPEEGRQEAVQTLIVALEGAGEQRTEYWRNRIVPYWKSIWPKSRIYTTQALSVSLAELCLAAREAFPEALEELRPWLQLVQGPDLIVLQLGRDDLCTRHPKAGLDFLDVIVKAHARWPPHDLEKCLNNIKAADHGLEEDSRFRRLMELLR